MLGLFNMDELVDFEGMDELILETGRPPIAVSQGQCRFLEAPLVNTSNAIELLRSLTSQEQRLELEQKGALEFTYAGPARPTLRVRAIWHGGSPTLELLPRAPEPAGERPRE